MNFVPIGVGVSQGLMTQISTPEFSLSVETPIDPDLWLHNNDGALHFRRDHIG